MDFKREKKTIYGILSIIIACIQATRVLCLNTQSSSKKDRKMNYIDDVVLPVWRFIFNNAFLLMFVFSLLAGLGIGISYRAEDDTIWYKYGLPACLAVMCGLFLPVIIAMGVLLLPILVLAAGVAILALGAFLLGKFLKERKEK